MLTRLAAQFEGYDERQDFDRQNAQSRIPDNIRATMFVNSLPKEVPVAIRQNAWGLANHRWPLTFLDKNEAGAMLLLIDKMAIDIKRAVPAWKITDPFIIELENFQLYCYSLIFSAKLRPAGGINERLANIKSILEQATTGGSAGKKRGFPFFGG